LKLLGLTYVSKAKMLFDNNLLEKLASQFAERNTTYKITGYLYFDKGVFVQYVEGAHSSVRQLLSKIKKDHRHEVLNVLRDDQLVIRRFPNWAMKWLDKNRLCEINIEFILTDYLIFSAQTKNIVLNEKTVWRMIDKLSTIRNKV